MLLWRNYFRKNYAAGNSTFFIYLKQLIYKARDAPSDYAHDMAPDSPPRLSPLSVLLQPASPKKNKETANRKNRLAAIFRHKQHEFNGKNNKLPLLHYGYLLAM